ncbi:MAG: STAS domain-containing protein [Planctomycetota bacterium]
MRIEKQTVGAVTILAFQGEFDAAGTPEAIEETDKLIEGCARVVFNLRGVTFINSSGLGYLLKTAQALEDQGGELVVSEPAECFKKIVDVYEVDKVFHVCPHDLAALAHFGEGGSAA